MAGLYLVAACVVGLLQISSGAEADLNAAVGATVRFMCDYSSVNLEFGDIVSWNKIDENDPSTVDTFAVFGEVADNWKDLYTMAYTQTATMLTVKVQSASQSGAYQCEIRRQSKVITAALIRLKVHELPLINCSKSLAVLRGTPATISCLVKSSDPVVRFTWLQNGAMISSLNSSAVAEAVTHTATIARVREDGDSLLVSLEIGSVSEGSYGLYTLRVTTDAGSASENVSVAEVVETQSVRDILACSPPGAQHSPGQLKCENVQHRRILARRLYQRHCRHAGTGSTFYCWKLALQLQALGMTSPKERSELAG